ncbi:MAG: phage virion morphogenesis protein [Prevotellaceae bacterium]|jgi:phage gpG-like protein|nr:phage virion morphogenesis protein [Prevotellaceae bacterium]
MTKKTQVKDAFAAQLLNDLKVELADEFDKNFERKSFFGRPWSARKSGRRGSLMLVSGRLRRSLRAQVRNEAVVFTSDAPYAAMHNEGGTIKVTAKMKRYFWAKYYELSGRVKVNARTRTISKGTQRYSIEAEYYRSLALMRVGSMINIPERRFIGDSPEVQAIIKKISDRQFKAAGDSIRNLLKQKK